MVVVSCSYTSVMYRKKWKASRWWKDNVFSSPFSGAGKWKNTWPEKRRKKRSAWQAAFDYLPDLDDRYDMLSSALPLIGFSNDKATSSRQLTANIGNSHFYPRDAMLARVIVIATCLSLRPSRAGIVSKRRKLAA